MLATARSYVAQHWRGELSLLLSFWLNGVLLNIALYAGAEKVWEALLPDFDPALILVASVSMWAVYGLVTLWQVVGIWRSANSRIRELGSSSLAGLAQVTAVLGVLAALGQFSIDAALRSVEAYRALTIDDTLYRSAPTTFENPTGLAQSANTGIFSMRSVSEGVNHRSSSLLATNLATVQMTTLSLVCETPLSRLMLFVQRA